MSVLKLNYTLPLLLVTLLAIGGVKAFYWFIENQFEEGSLSQKAAVASSISQANATSAKKVEKTTDISAITRRNLFASRAVAPAQKLPEKIEEAVPSSLAVVLMGTVTGTDGEERAIIYDKKERKQELYQEGDFLQQAAIKEIIRGKVIITLNGRDEILDIAEARNVKVLQYKKPAVPNTTSQRVIGRAVGSQGNQKQPAATEVPEGLTVPIPRPNTPKQIKSNKSGIIIKGRMNPTQNGEQQENANNQVE